MAVSSDVRTENPQTLILPASLTPNLTSLIHTLSAHKEYPLAPAPVERSLLAGFRGVG